MHKSTLILDFFKGGSRPPSGGSFTAYGILLCYANFNAMLICYISEGTGCEIVYGGTRVGGNCLA